MPDIDSPLVQQQQAWYLARPDYLRRVVERSRRYMHHIIEELEKRGMPTELALLPIVESAYNPMAYSRAHASGMWQFIPSTGKTYQLDQNWWMDQRRDIIASTSAALDYLQSIYEMHGDWHLALASYNWGENAVARAINKNRAKGLPTDYLSLSMPNETRWYVPKLQALKNIIARPQLFNVSLDPIPNKPYFQSIEVATHIDVAIAARLAEMTVEEFLGLSFLVWAKMSAPDGGNIFLSTVRPQGVSSQVTRLWTVERIERFLRFSATDVAGYRADAATTSATASLSARYAFNPLFSRHPQKRKTALPRNRYLCSWRKRRYRQH